MRSFKKNIFRTIIEQNNTTGTCNVFLGGTFKGPGGYNATFGYLDCGGNPQTITTPLPINPEPGNQYAFDLFPEPICVIVNSVYRISPSIIPALNIIYGDLC